MLTIRAMSDGIGYSSRHLEHSDYYAEGERVTGVWQGRGAELLGLSGSVATEEFEALRQGLDPETHEFLRIRRSADRTAADGTTLAQGRSLYDFTISAPKSVSILAIIGGDDRLIEAHRKAVSETLQEAETYAASRVRQAGANEDRSTGNLALAVYHHDTSRELDPQLHTHAVTANLTYDSKEGRWKALQASGIYERRAYLTEVYRNALAREVRALGYEIENQRNPKGIDNGFELKGISRDLREQYSQRSEQRDASIRQFMTDYGRPPSDNEIAVLVRGSRPDKLREISTAEVHRLQMSRISTEQRVQLTELQHQSQLQNRIREPKQGIAASSFDHSKEHLFERKTVAKDHELFTEALRHGRGQLSLSELRGNHESQVVRGELLNVGGHVATHASLEREREMVASIDRGMNRYPELGARAWFQVKESLRLEQRQTVEAILHSTDFAINLRGAAGTGKTATLQEINRGLLLAGHDVVAVAPTRSAVEELQKVGFGNAMTISRILEDETAQQSIRGNVLIIDEAGMVSGRQMEGLLDPAHREEA